MSASNSLEKFSSWDSRSDGKVDHPRVPSTVCAWTPPVCILRQFSEFSCGSIGRRPPSFPRGVLYPLRAGIGRAFAQVRSGRVRRGYGLQCVAAAMLAMLPLYASRSQAQQAGGQSIGPGAEQGRELASGDVHVYSVRLRAGDYLHARIDSSGIDAALAVYGPDAVKLAESSYRLPGAKCIALIAGISGDHRLEVHALETTPVVGRYRLEVTEVRVAVRGDSDRVVATKLFAEGEALQALWDANSSKNAVPKYREAVRLWTSAGDLLAAGRTLRRLGDTFSALGQTEKALRHYQESLQRSKEAGDPKEQSEALNSLSRLYLHLGQPEMASKYGRLALEIATKTGDIRGEADALNNIGDVKALLGETRECLAVYTNALKVSEGSGDRRLHARTLLNIGYAYSDLRDTSEALESYQRALSLWTSLADQRGRATTLNALGHLHGNIGERQEALGYYREARESFSKMGDPFGEGVAFSGMGFQYLELGEVTTALKYFQEQLRLHRIAGHRNGEAGALVQIGRCFFLLGDHKKALDAYRQSLAMNELLRDRRMEAYVLGFLGMTYEDLTNYERALRLYEQSWSLSQDAGDPREAAYALNRMARVFHKRGRNQEAVAHLENALALSRRSMDRFGESLALSNLAEVAADLGQYEVALSRIKESLKVSESLRRSVASYELRASYLASVWQRHELEVEVLMRLHTREPLAGYDRLALEASERARARSLLESLFEAGVDIRRGVDPALLAREQSLRRRLDGKAERLVRLIGDQAHQEEARVLDQEIREVTTQYDAIQSEIRSRSPHYAALTQPQTLSVDEIQKQVLDGDTLLLEYALGEKHSYLWAVSRKERASYELAPRAQIEKLARHVAELLRARQSMADETVRDYRRRVRDADATYWQTAARLSELVLGPVAGKIAGKRLVVVSDGALQYVPFGALPAPEAAHCLSSGNTSNHEDRSHCSAADESVIPGKAADPVPMVVQHEIVSLPSASALAVLRRVTSNRQLFTKSVVVLADPVFDRDDPRVRQKTDGIVRQSGPTASADASQLNSAVYSHVSRLIPRLASTRQEATGIVASAPKGTSLVATGFDASRTTVMKPELGRYRIVHFATHAVANSDNPELSGIILSMVDKEGRQQNGFLALHDIYNLELPADLVVLSACNSALGKDVHGEGLVGMTRGFMYAGASRVVASLWKVDDLATKELMVRFYRNIFDKGESPAAALRSAQIEMWRKPDWKSPYYWAAFALQGEWK